MACLTQRRGVPAVCSGSIRGQNQWPQPRKSKVRASHTLVARRAMLGVSVHGSPIDLVADKASLPRYVLPAPVLS